MSDITSTEPLVYEQVYVDEVHRTQRGFEVKAVGFHFKHGDIALTLLGTGQPRPDGVDVATKLRITVEVVS